AGTLAAVRPAQGRDRHHQDRVAGPLTAGPALNEPTPTRSTMAYSQKIIDHYERPRNVGNFGSSQEVKARKDIGVGLVGAPECGDVMQLQIKVNQETGV